MVMSVALSKMLSIPLTSPRLHVTVVFREFKLVMSQDIFPDVPSSVIDNNANKPVPLSLHVTDHQLRVLLLTRHERVLSVRFMVTVKVVIVGILSALGAPVIRIRSAGAYPATSPPSPGVILFIFALPVVEPSIGGGPRVSLGSIIIVIPHIRYYSHARGLMFSVLDAYVYFQSSGSSSSSVANLWGLLPFSGLPFCLLVIFAVHSVLSAGVLLSVSV